MKKNITLFTIFGLFFLALIIPGCIDAFHCVKGNRDLIKEERPAGEFDKVKVLGAADVFIKQGDKFSIIIETDNNIIRDITTNISAGELTIGTKNNICPSKLKVDVTMPTVQGLSMIGSGDFYIENGLNFKKLFIDIRGSGDAKCENLVGEDLILKVSGSGDIKATGKAENLDIAVSGSGGIDLKNLYSMNCNAKVSGSGDLKVNVSSVLNAKVSGSGDIIYWGNPKANTSVSGSGSIHKAD